MQRHVVLIYSTLILFSILTVLVYIGSFKDFDREVITIFQHYIPEIVDVPFSLFSILGSAEVASIVLLSVMLLMPILRNIFTLVFFVLTGVIELTFKYFLDQVAPPLALLKTHSFFYFPSSSIPQEFYSYPSGHTARTAFISLLVILIIFRQKKISKNLKYFLIASILIFDFLMFFSRVYLGEHWATDVLGGLLLGAFLAGSAFYMIVRINKART